MNKLQFFYNFIKNVCLVGTKNGKSWKREAQKFTPSTRSKIFIASS